MVYHQKGSTVHIALTNEQERFRDKLRSYFDGLMTDEERYSLGWAHPAGGAYRRVVRQLGKDGWLGAAWPKEYGGMGLSAVEQFILYDEALGSGVPIPHLTVNTVGPTILQLGTEQQRAELLPRILAGEVHFSIGYTEPDSGTDLASLRTTAQRDGDEYIINGQKIFTSLIRDADYVWLAARTNPEVPKHKGISVFIVSTDAVGFSYGLIHTLDGHATSATYYDNVRVSAANLVGRENDGWSLITSQLNLERVSLSCPGSIGRFYRDAVSWATTETDGRRPVDQSRTRNLLARVRMNLDVLRLMNWKVAVDIDAGVLSPADASAIKVFSSELFNDASRDLLEVYGEVGLIKAGSPGVVGRGLLEIGYRMAVLFTFGGGTNEIQRDLIATIGLGLPKSAA